MYTTAKLAEEMGIDRRRIADAITYGNISAEKEEGAFAGRCVYVMSDKTAARVKLNYLMGKGLTDRVGFFVKLLGG